MTWRRLLGIISLLALLGCREKEQPAPPPPQDAAQLWWKDHFSGPDKCETEFLIRFIVNDTLAMVEYARTGKPPANPQGFTNLARRNDSQQSWPIYWVTTQRNGRTAREPLDLTKQSVWSPDAYASLLAAHFDPAQYASVAHSAAGPSSPLLVSLLDSRVGDLARLNAEATQSLRKDFKSPEAHAEAALLLLTLAIEDHTGQFSDLRYLLCRATAHLTFVKAAAPNYRSDALLVANALRLALEGNEAGALLIVRGPAFDAPPMQPWRRIIELRSTRDYRPAEKNPPTHFVERTEAFRAYSHVRTNYFAGQAMRMEPAADPRWMAIIVGNEPDLAAGWYITTADPFVLHIKEARDAYDAFHGGTAGQSMDLGKMLNPLPSGFFADDGASFGDVIGWGHFAHFFQRQLCDDAYAYCYFFDQTYGDWEKGAEIRNRVRGEFKDLWLMAAVRAASPLDIADYHKQQDAFYRLSQEKPGLIGAGTWCLLSWTPVITDAPYFPAGEKHPYANEWFFDNPPPGTAHDLANRRYFYSFTTVPGTPKHSAEVAAIAPYNGRAIYTWLHANNKSYVPLGRVTEVLGELPNYDARACVLVSDTLADSDAVSLLKRVAPIAPAANALLSTKYSKLLTPDDLASTAESLMPFGEFGLDTASLTADMVQLYWAQGRKSDAARWAEFGRGVASHRGLVGAALYEEKEGRYAESLAILEGIKRRYNDDEPYRTALVRFKSQYGYSGADTILNEYVASLFPNGKRAVTLASFSAPPVSGVLILDDSDIAKSCGIEKGAIIVACNGITVENHNQYEYLRDSNFPAPIRLIIYQYDRYTELQADPPNRKFQVNMKTWKR